MLLFTGLNSAPVPWVELLLADVGELQLSFRFVAMSNARCRSAKHGLRGGYSPPPAAAGVSSADEKQDDPVTSLLDESADAAASTSSSSSSSKLRVCQSSFLSDPLLPESDEDPAAPGSADDIALLSSRSNGRAGI